MKRPFVWQSTNQPTNYSTSQTTRQSIIFVGICRHEANINNSWCNVPWSSWSLICNVPNAFQTTKKHSKYIWTKQTKVSLAWNRIEHTNIQIQFVFTSKHLPINWHYLDIDIFAKNKNLSHFIFRGVRMRERHLSPDKNSNKNKTKQKTRWKLIWSSIQRVACHCTICTLDLSIVDSFQNSWIGGDANEWLRGKPQFFWLKKKDELMTSGWKVEKLAKIRDSRQRSRADDEKEKREENI